jgi:hypothetical protein
MHAGMLAPSFPLRSLRPLPFSSGIANPEKPIFSNGLLAPPRPCAAVACPGALASRTRAPRAEDSAGPRRAGQGRAGQGRAGQGRAGQGRA